MLEPGEFLFRTGDRSRFVYYLADGLLRAEYTSNSGRPELLGYFERGMTFGLTFMRFEPFTVLAVNRSRVIAFRPLELSNAVAAHPYAAARVAAFATKPMSDILGYLQVCQIEDLISRLAAYILLDFDRRGRQIGDIEMLELRGSAKDWGLLLDMSDDAVARGLDTLVDVGVLKRLGPSRIGLVDRSRLEFLAGRSMQPAS